MSGDPHASLLGGPYIYSVESQCTKKEIYICMIGHTPMKTLFRPTITSIDKILSHIHDGQSISINYL
jgi:hypothetical protein